MSRLACCMQVFLPGTAPTAAQVAALLPGQRPASPVGAFNPAMLSRLSGFNGGWVGTGEPKPDPGVGGPWSLIIPQLERSCSFSLPF